MAIRPDATASPLIARRASRILGPVQFRVVQTLEELKAAANLVYREYLQRGYIGHNAAELKLSIYQAFSTTTTFIALDPQLGIIATLSLVLDSPAGLPMDEIYKAELDELRRRGQKLAEASMLALDSRLFTERVFTLFHPKKMILTLRVFKLMIDYLRACTPVDELVACFNPKHQSLYDLLQMQPLGPLKAYPGANGNPAVARRLNMADGVRLALDNPIMRFFFGKAPSPKRFAKRIFLSYRDLQELFVRSSSILASASHTELEHLKACYPAFDVDRLVADATHAVA